MNRITTVEQFLSTKNIPYKLSGDKLEIAIDCLFCADTKKHLYINNYEGCFHCKKCGAKGSWKNLLDRLGERHISLEGKENDAVLYKAKIKEEKLILDKGLADKYHSQFPSRVLNYLKSDKRGLTEETIKKFKIGWDGNSITIPVFDLNNNLINIRHRRDPNKSDGPKMWNEKGGKASLFNIRVLKESPKFIIITEGEFDCMIAVQNGFPAVCSTAGASTFKEEWVKEFDRIKTIYICYDTDEAGQKGAKNVASLFANRAKIIELPSNNEEKVDLTDYFVRLKHTPEDFKKLIALAKEFIPEAENQENIISISGFIVNFKDLKKIIFEKDGLEYAIYSVNGYKIDIGVSKNKQLLNRDNLLITSSKSRATFCKNCQKTDNEIKKLIANHLIEIIEVLEKITEKQIKAGKAKKAEKLSEEEKQEAKKLLQSPTLLFDILQFIKKLDVAGEEKTALTHYIVLTSRITDEPLSEVVKGESAVGKSYVISQILEMFPKEAYIDITDATAQSFYYVPKDYFAHKVVVVFERHGAEKTDYSIRSLQSEKKLKLQVTVKDPETGQFMTTEKEVDGPTGFISTTTEAKIHNENETRILSLYPDESLQQTSRILEIADLKYRGILGPNKKEIKKWRNIQKILKPYPIFIPFVEEIRKDFPKEPLRVRRDYSKFLCLLSVIALLHQEQREKEKISEKEYLVATLADFYIAKILFEEALQKTIYEIPPKSEYLIKQARELTSETLEEFSIKELAIKINWDYDTAWKWFSPAYQKGFFVKTEEHRGSKPAKYKLTDKKIEDQKILPDTAELYEKSKEWLGEAKIYNPLTGEVLEFKEIDCTDVPTEEKGM